MRLLLIGTRVELEIHSLGGRCETVTGTVVGYNRRGNLNVVATESGHGEVVVSADEAKIL